MLLLITLPVAVLLGLALGQCLIRFTRRVEINAVHRVRHNRAHMRFMKRSRAWQAARGLAV